MQATLVNAMIRLEPRERTISELDDIDQLVRQYRTRLFRFVSLSIGDQDTAESIVQDCFTKAYAARHTFRGDCSIATWLNGIALNLVRDHQRTGKFRFWKKVRETAIDITDLSSSLRSNRSSPEDQLLAQEKVRQVASVMDRLSSHQRTIFLLRFQEEMEIAEISAAMKMPASTVKTHLHRAVKAVRQEIGGSR